MKNFLANILTSLSQYGVNNPAISVSDNDLNFSYIIKYPTGDSHKSDNLPMLIALHGDGDTVENFYESTLSQLSVNTRIILVKGPISHECGYVWPFSIAQFKKYGIAFSEIATTLENQYPTTGKPILLGFSGGGGMAYYQAVKHGDCFSYIFSISSLLAKEKLGGKASRPDAKVYAYHGISDAVIPFSEGKKTVQLLKKKKVNVSFTEFEGGHHGLLSNMKTKITNDIEAKLRELSA